MLVIPAQAAGATVVPTIVNMYDEMGADFQTLSQLNGAALAVHATVPQIILIIRMLTASAG